MPPPTDHRAEAGFWSRTPDEMFTALATGASGLSTRTAAKRLKSHEYNRLEGRVLVRPLRLFLRQFKSPLVLILVFAAVAVAVAAVVLVYLPPAAALFGFVPLPWPILLWLAGITLGYAAATAIVKIYFFRSQAGGSA